MLINPYRIGRGPGYQRLPQVPHSRAPVEIMLLLVKTRADREGKVSEEAAVVGNDLFGNVCDVISGALGGAWWTDDVIIPLTVPNPRLHEPTKRSKPYLFNAYMFQINLVSN